MPPSRPNDQSLLDRLNALKPTAVTFEKPANTAAVPGQESQPVSREDALAARLRLLRSSPSSSSVSRDKGVSQQGGSPHTSGVGGDECAGTAPPPPVKRPAQDKVVNHAPSRTPNCPRTVSQERPSYRFDDLEVDDEAALDELLGALGDEDFDLAADQGVEPPLSFDLKAYQKGSGNSTVKQVDTSAAEDDDDDSDGEQMSRAVETLLSQVADEINSLPPPAETEDHVTGQRRQSGETQNKAETDPASKPTKGNSNDDGSDNEPAFTLPTVPSQLVDPAPTTTNPHQEQDAFESDISARMASLRGLGSLDALGLPSAPTFRPQDHNPSSSSSGAPLGKDLLRSSKYTDEDQKTWCVVCLEDAAIRCVGCDDDVYCARCWKEMHVGPSAGYDERGHRWVRFERTGRP